MCTLALHHELLLVSVESATNSHWLIKSYLACSYLHVGVNSHQLLPVVLNLGHFGGVVVSALTQELLLHDFVGDSVHEAEGQRICLGVGLSAPDVEHARDVYQLHVGYMTRQWLHLDIIGVLLPQIIHPGNMDHTMHTILIAAPRMLMPLLLAATAFASGVPPPLPLLLSVLRIASRTHMLLMRTHLLLDLVGTIRKLLLLFLVSGLAVEHVGRVQDVAQTLKPLVNRAVASAASVAEF